MHITYTHLIMGYSELFCNNTYLDSFFKMSLISASAYSKVSLEILHTFTYISQSLIVERNWQTWSTVHSLTIRASWEQGINWLQREVSAFPSDDPITGNSNLAFLLMSIPVSEIISQRMSIELEHDEIDQFRTTLTSPFELVVLLLHDIE